MTPSPFPQTPVVQTALETVTQILTLSPLVLQLISMIQSLFGHHPSSAVSKAVVSNVLANVNPDVATGVTNVVAAASAGQPK